MKAKDIKPGMVLAWKPKYHGWKTIKVQVVGPGQTEGNKFSYQGTGPQKGWRVEVLDGQDVFTSKSTTDKDGNFIATGRDLLGPWDEYVAQQVAERQKMADEAEARDAAQAKQEDAVSDLYRLCDAHDVDGTVFLGTSMDFTAVELLDLIKQFTKENE